MAAEPAARRWRPRLAVGAGPHPRAGQAPGSEGARQVPPAVQGKVQHAAAGGAPLLARPPDLQLPLDHFRACDKISAGLKAVPPSRGPRAAAGSPAPGGRRWHCPGASAVGAACWQGQRPDAAPGGPPATSTGHGALSAARLALPGLLMRPESLEVPHCLRRPAGARAAHGPAHSCGNPAFPCPANAKAVLLGPAALLKAAPRKKFAGH